MADQLCPPCWQGVRHTLKGAACPVCGREVGGFALLDGGCGWCRHRRLGLDHVVRVGHYRDVMREMILAWKFSKRREQEAILGQLLTVRVAADPRLQTVDWVVPVPLHWRRQWQRGFNQAEILARYVIKGIRQAGGSARLCRDLLRMRDTHAQSSLDWEQRQWNFRGAFAVRPDTPLRGSHVCLVDDVTTSGTTLAEAARAIETASPRRISAAVMAVAGLQEGVTIPSPE